MSGIAGRLNNAVTALFAGLVLALRAPVLLAGIALLTLGMAAPFGVIVGWQVQDSLATQPPVDLGNSEIDAEWWLEFRAHAPGLAATFTPAIIGFAAPLDNLSALADGSPRPFAFWVPVAAFGLLWALLWGGLLSRFHAGRRLGPGPFWSAAWRAFPTNVAIGAAAALANLVLFLTVHAVLFGPVYGWLSARADSPREAFLWRVSLYLVFGCLLALVVLIADYARVHVSCAGASTARAAITGGVRFVRAHASSVFTLYLLSGALFVALLAAYGLVDTIGETRVGGWRGVLLGQIFIAGRLALRLASGASEVRLFALSAGVERPAEARAAGGEVSATGAAR